MTVFLLEVNTFEKLVHLLAKLSSMLNLRLEALGVDNFFKMVLALDYLLVLWLNLKVHYVLKFFMLLLRKINLSKYA